MAASSLFTGVALTGVAAPLRRALGACRAHFAAAAAFSALVNILYLAPTLYMLLVYDRVMPTNGVETLVLVSLVGLTAVATLAFLEWMRSRLLVRSSARLERELAGPVMAEVLRQADLSRTDRSQAMRQFDTFRQAVTGQAILTAFDAPWTPIYVLAAFLLHPLMGLMCLGSGGLMLGLAWLNEKATHPPLAAANAAAAIAYGKQDHASAWAAEIRSLGMGRALVAKQMQERQELVRLQTVASFAAARYGGLIRFARLVLQSAALGVGAWLAIERQISAGSVIAASLLLTRALAPVEQIVGSWKTIIQARGAFEALNRLFAGAKPEDAHIRLPEPRGEIAIEGVSVQTPTLDRIALADVSLEIEAGRFVGVIGPSGAGKSTLLRLLAGAAQPKSGVVRIDGAAMTDWEPERLARHIGFLPQEFLLFSGSIKDNISRFRAHLGEEAIEAIDAETIRAAQAAGAHEMILRLPQGYATQVGLGGAGLSAGQTQRVALARALFGRPQIVILDEPNAHLDADGEQQLVETLTELKKQGVTIIVAAHRGAVLSVADKLALVQAGQIALYGQLNEVLTAMRAPPAHAPAPAQAMRA
jgi:ATP-binding cassette subfamily C protein